MPTLVAIEQKSTTFIRRQLGLGRGLGQQLLKQLKLDSGSVHAVLPADSASSMAHEYADGALRDTAQEHEVVKALATYLEEEHGVTVEPDVLLLCQFPDGAVRRSATGGVKASPMHKTLWLVGADRNEDNGELWYVDSRSDLASSVKLLSDALWVPAIGVVTQVTDETARVIDGGDLQHDDLRKLVKRARAVLVGAWDEMNYLIWTPAS